MNVYFDRNENQYGPAPACFEVLKTADIAHMSMYSRDFTRGVKSRLSERLAGIFGIPEASVLLGYGGEDLLKQTVHCYLSAGETVMIPNHSWWYYKSIAEEVDGIRVEYPLVPREHDFGYDLPALKKLYDEHRPALVLISSPNNPTGNSISQEELRDVLAHMRETIVVLDEAYWSYENDSSSHVHDLLADFPNLLIIRTFSKYYALAGVRIGFALLGSGLSRLSQYAARYLGYHRLSEEVALAALDSEAYYRDIAVKMEEDRQRFYAELGALPGFTVYRSDANFVLVAIPHDLRAELKEYLAARGLIVKFMSEELLNSHLRITLGTQEQNRLLIDAITSFVHQRVSV